MMIVNYRVWLRDRETNKRSCFVTSVFTNDIIESAHTLMLLETDKEYSCYRVDFINIEYFQV